MGGVFATDAVIIGAGPCGLHAAFHLGILALRCHVIDSLDHAGGQCAALYPDKVIYDIPGFSRITGSELTERLVEQVRAVQPVCHFGETVADVQRDADGRFRVVTQKGLVVHSRVVVLASGGGALLARDNGSHALQANPAQFCGAVLRDGGLEIDAATCQTSVAGLFALGDVASYPGKLKVIVSGFHEAALMAQRAFVLLNDSSNQR